MTVPIIDGIDHETFAYRSVYQDHQHFRGIFEWGMLYKVREKSASHKKISDYLHTHPTCMTRLQETELPEKEASKREHGSEPYPSPTHAGGLFAINREYFLSLGAYDPGQHLRSFGELSRWLLLAINDLLMMCLTLYNLQ